MKKIKINQLEETIYYEKLDNGLDIYMYSNDEFKNNYVTFTTKYGSIYDKFIPLNEDKMMKVPDGIAHFLEHKVFEQEQDPQPDVFFSNSGSYLNAYTTFKNTTYLFSGPNNIIDNTLYLLDYVQSPYFTKENVEKEKGIITQEIHMGEDNPSNVLYEHIRNNCFHKNPFKKSIIGTVKDINSIDKDLLLTCYQRFYHPKNMFLVIVGNFSPREILEKIKDNQAQKEFSKEINFSLPKYHEEDNVAIEEETIIMKTLVPKMAFNIKINYQKLKIPKLKIILYLSILMYILFDETSDFDERMKEENIITSYIAGSILDADSHLIVSLVNETKNYSKLIKEIQNELANIHITKNDFERKKKAIISNEIFAFDYPERINDLIISDIIFNNKIEGNILDIINSLNYQELEDIIKKLDLSNTSIIIIKNQES